MLLGKPLPPSQLQWERSFLFLPPSSYLSSSPLANSKFFAGNPIRRIVEGLL